LSNAVSMEIRSSSIGAVVMNDEVHPTFSLKVHYLHKSDKSDKSDMSDKSDKSDMSDMFDLSDFCK